jgi:DNA polymerase III epsilon subunit family exonuclease
VAQETSYPNIVSDSILVEEIIEILRDSSETSKISATLIAERVLQVPNLDIDTATFLVSEIIKDDARVRLTDAGELEFLPLVPDVRMLDETDFVVVDVETTGARTPPCRITEIGAYRVRAGQIVAEFETLVNPETEIPPFISQLTGITNLMVLGAPTFARVADEWLSFAGDAVLVAHNAPFDTRFLNHEIARMFPNRRMSNESLCTVNLSRRVLPGLSSYRLDSVAEHLNISIRNRHRAGGDARATAEIFLEILKVLTENGVRDVAGMHRFRIGKKL